MNADPGAKEFEWPEIKDMRPADAARLLYDIEVATTAANARAKRLTSRKAQARKIVEAVAEEYELPEIATITSAGRKVRYRAEPVDYFSIDNPEAFRAWAETQSENYFDPTPKLREGIFRDEMRRRVQDREPLPPGVRRYTDTKLSRSTVQ